MSVDNQAAATALQFLSHYAQKYVLEKYANKPVLDDGGYEDQLFAALDGLCEALGESTLDRAELIELAKEPNRLTWGGIVLETAIEQCEKDIRAVADRHRLKVLDEFLINGDAAIFTVVGYKDDLLHAFNIGVSGYEARRNSGDELSMIVKHKAEVACATIAKEMAGE